MGSSAIVVNHRVVLAGTAGRGAVASYRLGYISARPGAVAVLTDDDRRLAEQAVRMERELGYVGYRPGAQLPAGEEAPHALFDQHGIPDRAQVARELRENEGAVITSVVSVRLEDAERLGLSTRQDWERLLRAEWGRTVERMGVIAPEDVRWVAAVHRNETSVHVHIFTYDASQRFNSLLPKRRMEAAREELVRRALRPAREGPNLAKTQARDELVQKLKKRLTDGDRERIRAALPPSGSLKYASLAKSRPEAKEEIDRVVSERVAACPDLKAAARRYLEAAASHAELKSLKGVRLQAHMDAAGADIAARLGNAAISESRAPSPAPEPPEYEPRAFEADEPPAQALRKRARALAEEAASCLGPAERARLEEALASGGREEVRRAAMALPSVRASIGSPGRAAIAPRIAREIRKASEEDREGMDERAGRLALRALGRALLSAVSPPPPREAHRTLRRAERAVPNQTRERTLP